MPLLALLLGSLLAPAPPAEPVDVFDFYTNRALERMVETKHVKEIKELTPSMIVENDGVLPRVHSAFLIVKTNNNRWAKLLVQAARQRVDADRNVPILSIERFVTYKDGEEQTILASGKNLSLYNGFRLGLDLGQVVPEVLGGDLRFVATDDKVFAEPLGKAKLYLVVKHDPTVVPKKAARFVIGEKFEPRFFSGTYRLLDDGRRSGKLILKVEDDNRTVTGAYYSDRDGQKYDVKGRIGDPQHQIEFAVRFPRTEQIFRGMLFTGDGKVLTGTSRMVGRESGFYAIRQE